MYRYTRTDFDRVLEFVRGLYEPRTPQALREHVVSALHALVPATFAVCGTAQLGADQSARTVCSNPPEFSSPEMDAAIARHLHEGPIFSHCARSGSEQFTRRSDLLPIWQFERSALYNEVYRQMGVKDCCTVVFSFGRDRFEGVGIGLHQPIPDTHRDILVSLSPHLPQAFRLAHTTSALFEIAAMKSGPNCSERGLMAIDLNETITMETDGATRLLEKFFSKRTERGLPDQLAQWVSRSDQILRKATDVPDARRNFVIERAGSRLTVHLLSKPAQNFLVLEEHRSALDPAALSSLRLTRREAEVLAYIALGKTNPEIAIILGISTRTVSKHVEHILASLGVETRTAAATAALEAANL